MDGGLLRELQVPDVGGVLLARVVQLAALAQSLVVDGQGYGLHVHELVVGDGGLASKQQKHKLEGPGRRARARASASRLTERRVWSLCLMTSCSCLSTVTLVCSSSSC